MTVFVVMEGDWGYDLVRGVFSTRAAAEKCAAQCQLAALTAGLTIQEWTVDEAMAQEQVFARH